VPQDSLVSQQGRSDPSRRHPVRRRHWICGRPRRTSLPLLQDLTFGTDRIKQVELPTAAAAVTLGLMRPDKALNSRSWTRSTIYQDRDGAVGQNFDCLATQDNCRDPAPPVGGHHNQIAPFCLRRINNSLERMLVLDMDCIATYTGSGCSVLHLSEGTWLQWSSCVSCTIRMCL
jgi:hypothetical protein